MTKISAFGVAKETYRLFWRAKRDFFLIGLVGSVVPQILSILSGLFTGMNTYKDVELPLTILSVLIAVLGGLAITVTACHLAVTTLRGDGRVFPAHFLASLGRVTLASLKIFAIFSIMGLVVAIPANLFLPLLDGLQPPEVFYYLIPLSLIFAGVMITAFWFLSRLNLIIPAAAMNERLTIKEALGISKGYGWRMLLSTILIYVPTVFLSIIPVGILGAATATDIAPHVSSIFALVVTVTFTLIVGAIQAILMPIVLAIWHERLRTIEPVVAAPATAPAAPADEDDFDLS